MEAGINSPPFHPYCRCTTCPYFDDMEGYRASRNDEGKTVYEVPANMTYEEWKEKFIYVDKENLKSRGRKKTPISEETIETPQGIRYYGMNKEKSEKLNQMHDELLKYAKEHNNSNEVAFVIKDDLSSYKTQKGSSTQLNFSGSALDMLGTSQKLYIAHNHPSNASFSMYDVLFLLENNNVEMLSLITNNGRIEALIKTAKYDKILSGKVYVALYNKMQPANDASRDRFVDKLLSIFDAKGWIKWKKKK